MKLVLFVPQLACGGAQQVALLLSSAFVRLQHNVTIAAPSLTGELLRLVEPRCSLRDLHAIKPIRAQRQLAQLVNEIRPDAVICFGIFTGIAAALSRRHWRAAPALIIRNENNLHLDWQEGTQLNRLFGPPLSRWAARSAQIIAVSRALRRPTACFLRVPLSRVTTILNPVFGESARTDTGADTDVHPWLQDRTIPVFVAMGRLEHQKGFDVLIDAFAAVRRENVARLLIFGEGSLHQALQTRIDSTGQHDAITLAGYTPTPIAQMRAAHAFVLSSRFEGFGLVLVEALYAGTQVIATDCDYGPAEILERGRYGSLVPVDNACALADAMRMCIRNSDRLHRPPEAWFQQFTASEAARRHLAVIRATQ